MKKNLVVILTLIIALTFAGCQKEEASNQTPSGQSAVSAAATFSSPSSASPSPSSSASVSPSVAVTATPGQDKEMEYKSDKITVEYYDVEKQKNVEVTVDVGENTTSESAIDAATKAIFEKAAGDSGVKTNSIVFSDGNVFIDFTKDIYSLNLGSSGEIAVLDAIADAYLNNVVGVKAVYFTVDGNAYSSGHIEIPKGEAYKVK